MQRQPFVGLHYLENFTATGEGERVVCDALMPSKHALSVRGVGGKLTTWSVKLQGSLDGINWTDLLTHSTTEGSVVYPADAIHRPVNYLRVAVGTLTLGDATSARVSVLSRV